METAGTKEKAVLLVIIRLRKDGIQLKRRLRQVGVNVINRQLNGSDLFRFFIRDLGFELFFRAHNQSQGTRGAAPRVSYEGGLVLHSFSFSTRLFATIFFTRFSILLLINLYFYLGVM